MPDLGWDIAKTQLQRNCKQIEVQESSENSNPHPTSPLQTVIKIAILITTLLENITTYLQEIPEIAKKAAQLFKIMTARISHNKPAQNIKNPYKTTLLAVNPTTDAMDCTSDMTQPQTTNGKTQKSPNRQKLNDKYGRLYPPHTPKAPDNTCN